jgi:glycosyltransferase involved in cell wall biosynthesis
MLSKCCNYLKQRGLSALFIKISERLKWKKAAREYMKNADTYKENYIKAHKNISEDTKISICVPLYNTNKVHLCDMLNSVVNQSYKNWELCLADGSDSAHAYIKTLVSEYKDNRIIYKKLDKNMGIVGNSNAAVDMATGDYIALLDHDDILDKDALLCFAANFENADMLYSDEANFSTSAQKPDIIHFKPDFGIFNLRGNNYICHLLMFKKELFYAVGGFRNKFEGSQDHDLILRLAEKAKNIVHIPLVLYFWRVHSQSVAADISAKPYCIESGIRAVKSHLERMGIDGNVKMIGRVTSVYTVDYKEETDDYIYLIDKNLTTDNNSVSLLKKHIALKNVGAVCGLIVKGNKIISGGYENNKSKPLFAGVNKNSDGYMNRLHYAQNIDFVDCRFCMISKTAAAAVGGFDDKNATQESVNDICRKMTEAKYDIVLVPQAKSTLGR